MLAAIARIFGWVEQDWSDQSDFRWACVEEHEEIWAAAAALLAQDFGWSLPATRPWKKLPGFAGSIAFLPATPNKDPGLDLDVVTPHHTAYYEGKGWWYRCLGGSPTQEQTVFGGVRGKEVHASAIQVRVSNFQRSPDTYLPGFIRPGDPEAYHNYMLTAPNDQGQSRMWSTPPDDKARNKGIVRESAQIPQNSSFALSLIQLRRIADAEFGLLELAIESMLFFGAIGYRKSRGFGSWCADSFIPAKSELEELLKRLQSEGFTWKFAPNSNTHSMIVFRQIEGQLKGDKVKQTGFRLNHKAVSKTPLGYSHGGGSRQSSSVYFRPCAFKAKSGDLHYSLLTFQAPDCVLGEDVKRAYPNSTSRLI